MVQGWRLQLENNLRIYFGSTSRSANTMMAIDEDKDDDDDDDDDDGDDDDDDDHDDINDNELCCVKGCQIH